MKLPKLKCTRCKHKWIPHIRIRDHFQRYCKRCGINMPFIEDYRKVDMEKLGKNKDFEDWQ